MAKFAKDNNSKKKFEASSYNNFRNNLIPNLQRAITQTKKFLFKFVIFWLQISFWPFTRGITLQRETIQTKKIRVSYFLMRNPYMKFHKPNFF